MGTGRDGTRSGKYLVLLVPWRFLSRGRSRPAGVPGCLVHVSIYYIHRNMRRPKSSAAPLTHTPSTHTPSSTLSSSSASISHASTSGCPIQFFTRRSARAVLSTKRFRFFVINNEACLLVSFLPPPVQYGPPLIARLKESCGITAILRFLLSHKFRELFFSGIRHSRAVVNAAEVGIAIRWVPSRHFKS
jgi:hypothetical protein